MNATKGVVTNMENSLRSSMESVKQRAREIAAEPKPVFAASDVSGPKLWDRLRDDCEGLRTRPRSGSRGGNLGRMMAESEARHPAH